MVPKQAFQRRADLTDARLPKAQHQQAISDRDSQIPQTKVEFHTLIDMSSSKVVRALGMSRVDVVRADSVLQFSLRTWTTRNLGIGFRISDYI